MAVPILLPIGWFLLLVVGGVGIIGRQPFGMYLLAGRRGMAVGLRRSG